MKGVYSNDKKGPRMKKGEFSTSVVTKELYQRFCKEYPEYNITWNEFYTKWQDIARKIRESIIENPLGVKLAFFLGEIKLQYLPYKFKAIDNKISEELGEKTQNLHIITNGKTGKIKWERRQAVKKNKMLQFYGFNPIRDLNFMARDRINRDPNSLRISRNTLGGYSIWRQKIKRNDYKT